MLAGAGTGGAMSARRVMAIAVALCMAVAVTGCASRSKPAAAPTPPKVPGQAGAPDLANVSLPNFTMPLVTGGVSMPNHRLTPGAVATTDTTKVCVLPDHLATTVIPSATQQAVFTEYRIRNPVVQAKYDVDYLVPILLGGATTTANMWPAALKGTGPARPRDAGLGVPPGALAAHRAARPRAELVRRLAEVRGRHRPRLRVISRGRALSPRGNHRAVADVRRAGQDDWCMGRAPGLPSRKNSLVM